MMATLTTLRLTGKRKASRDITGMPESPRQLVGELKPPSQTGELKAPRRLLAGLKAPRQMIGELNARRQPVEEQIPPPQEADGLNVPRQPAEEQGSPQGDESPAEPFEMPDWAATVDRIRAGDSLAMTELYAVFTRGIRYLLLRSLGVEEVDDRVHDCFVIVAEAIRTGELRDPSRLMGYVRTVVRRQIAASIEEAITRRRTTVEFEDSVFSVTDWKNNPEQNLLARQRAEIARRVFNGVSRRDRDILRRFYLQEQSQEQICEEMGLTYNQFRLLKSRAKARFGKLGQRLAEGSSLGLTNPLAQHRTGTASGGNKAEKASGSGH